MGKVQRQVAVQIINIIVAAIVAASTQLKSPTKMLMHIFWKYNISISLNNCYADFLDSIHIELDPCQMGPK